MGLDWRKLYRPSRVRQLRAREQMFGREESERWRHRALTGAGGASAGTAVDVGVLGDALQAIRRRRRTPAQRRPPSDDDTSFFYEDNIPF